MSPRGVYDRKSKGAVAAAVAPAMEINNVSNDGQDAVEMQIPYTVRVTVEGVCPILFKRWSVEDVEAKANAPKGSDIKKTDNIDAALWRNDAGLICLPGEYLRMSIIGAARYMQDPRSPRKSAMDLMKAAVVSLTDVAPIIRIKDGKEITYKEPEYIDRRRVVVQRAGVTRQRPAFSTGWKATIELMCNLPEYVDPKTLNSLISNAGRLVGVGDFRPSFGRFNITEFKLLNGSAKVLVQR